MEAAKKAILNKKIPAIMNFFNSTPEKEDNKKRNYVLPPPAPKKSKQRKIFNFFF